jgi:hypothetical protein
MTDVVCYYRDPVKAPLLRDAVLPALAGTTGHVERHWLHGPHLRIRLTDAADQVATQVREYLAEHPSTVDISDSTLLKEARRGAVAELIAPPYAPIHPDNTVLVEPTDLTAVASLLGSPALVELRNRTLHLGLPAIREAVAVDVDSAGRVELAITAMTAHAKHFPGGLVNGYHSFLSHLEDFLHQNDPDGRLRTRFDRIWGRNADQVTEQVERTTDTAWATWTTASRLLIEEAFDRGDLSTDYNPRHGARAVELGDQAAIRRWNRELRTEFSDYHHALQGVDLDHPLYQRPVTVYRFGTNMLYQLLAVCDVTPIERYLAASLMSRATQRITGVGWTEHIAHMTEVTAR